MRPDLKNQKTTINKEDSKYHPQESPHEEGRVSGYSDKQSLGVNNAYRVDAPSRSCNMYQTGTSPLGFLCAHTHRTHPSGVICLESVPSSSM